MKDFFGNKLNVGDKIVVNDLFNGYFIQGEIVKLTVPSTVCITIPDSQNWEVTRPCYQVIKVPPKRLTLSTLLDGDTSSITSNDRWAEHTIDKILTWFNSLLTNSIKPTVRVHDSSKGRIFEIRWDGPEFHFLSIEIRSDMSEGVIVYTPSKTTFVPVNNIIGSHVILQGMLNVFMRA